MDEYLSEKEQLERIRKWWDENGRYVITGLALGGAILFGWKTWQATRITKAERASVAYSQLLTAVTGGDADTAQSLGKSLSNEYASTPYADHAALALAKLHVERGETEQAAQNLQRVVDGSRDAELAQIARLRLARVRLYQDQPAAALEVLDVGNAGKFGVLYYEVRGDAHVALGDADAARDAYQAALDSVGPGIGDSATLQMKLNSLGIAPAVETAATDGDES